MEPQTDGVEWVLGVLFGLGLLAVLAAAFREWSGTRRSRNDDVESTQQPGDASPPDDGPTT